MEKKKLAVVMIVKNEEADIRRCLDSYVTQGIDCDFYITDTGSTDNTIKICEEYGAKVFIGNPITRFDLARNESIRKIDSNKTYKWIMVIDADESFDLSVANRIKSIVESEEIYQKYDAFWFHRSSFKEYTRDSKLMLFKHGLFKEGKIFYQYWIHENVCLDFIPKNRIGHIFEEYNHYSNKKNMIDPKALESTSNFYCSIADAWYNSEKDNDNNWYVRWIQSQIYFDKIYKTNGQPLSKEEYTYFYNVFKEAIEIGLKSYDTVEVRFFGKLFYTFHKILIEYDTWRLFYNNSDEYFKHINNLAILCVSKIGSHPFFIKILAEINYLMHTNGYDRNSGKYYARQAIMYNEFLISMYHNIESIYEFNDLTFVGNDLLYASPLTDNIFLYYDIGSIKKSKECFNALKSYWPENDIVKMNEEFYNNLEV